MPRVMQAEGYSFTMFFKDHPPPHVHVWHSGDRCKIALGDADNAPYLMDGGDMRRTDARALDGERMPGGAPGPLEEDP